MFNNTKRLYTGFFRMVNNRVVEILSCIYIKTHYNFNCVIICCKTGNCLTHFAVDTAYCYSDHKIMIPFLFAFPPPHQSSSYCARMLRSASVFSADISQRGRRRGPASKPMRLRATFTGMGFTSIKSASMRGL